VPVSYGVISIIIIYSLRNTYIIEG
jgi:hypothetical protein